MKTSILKPILFLLSILTFIFVNFQFIQGQEIKSGNLIPGKVLIWNGSTTGNSYGAILKNFYDTLPAQSAVQMKDNSNSIPDLSTFTLVFIILPGRTLKSTELLNLKTLNDRGGRIVLVGEHSYWTATNKVINAIISDLGGHLSINSLDMDALCKYLPDIHINMSSPLMKGVTNLWGDRVSSINIGGDATILVKMRDNPDMIAMAQERIGNGDIIVWADANQWLYINDSTFGTATFFRNLLTNASEMIQSTATRVQATVTLSNLALTYDGSPKSVTASTTPAGLTVNFTYDGASSEPVNAGTYSVVATISNNNYKGSTSGSLVIDKADQAINFSDIPVGLKMKHNHTLEASATSGLPVIFEVSDRKIASVSENTLYLNKDGIVNIKAVQKGDNNWNPAPEVIKSITILPSYDNITSMFSPNSDGTNDYWVLPKIEELGTVQVIIYNRFSKLVYESADYKNDWDGTYNGTPLPSASYYYIIKSSEEGFIKGVVNLVR